MKNLIVLAALLFASVTHAGDFRGRGSCNDFNRNRGSGSCNDFNRGNRGGNGVTVVTRGARVFIR